MKKELFALALLLLILVGNVWNQHRLETLTSSLDTLVEEAYASARNGLWQQAAHAEIGRASCRERVYVLV